MTKIFNWFETVLSNRKDYIQKSESSITDLKYIARGVPQISILELLLLLVYVKGLPNASCLLDPIMFADHTNLLFNHKGIKYLFTVIKKELVSIKDWLIANSL